VKKIAAVVIVIVIVTSLGLAEETSFRRVWTPNQKGQQIKAVLTFSDQDKAIEVHPAKGAAVTIPYGTIDKCDYEYSDALMGEKDHWLEIHYRDQDLPKVFVLQMDKRDYLHILDALKAHTGIDAEVVGNARKR
jgi:hypothetical protein